MEEALDQAIGDLDKTFPEISSVVVFQIGLNCEIVGLLGFVLISIKKAKI
jgi:hypothetical protein